MLVRMKVCLVALAVLASCVPEDDAVDAALPQPEIRMCRQPATADTTCECTVDFEHAPCGAREVERCSDMEVGECDQMTLGYCEQFDCEWVVECDIGGCSCVVGFPAGRLVACSPWD